MALYETIYIVRQDMSADDVDKLTAQFEEIVAAGGGKVVSKEYWGLRKLAYKINKSDRGHYIMLNIDAKYEAVAELERKLSLNEDVVRNVTFNKTSDINENSELFVCKNAKDYKPAKVGTKKEEEEESKYGALLKKLQFDN